MSANGRALRCGVTPAVISGSLFGTGTLAIPVGVVSVTVSGAGAPGGNDYVYHPGQPYVPEVAFSYGSGSASPYYLWISNGGGSTITSSSTPYYVEPSPRPTAEGQTYAGTKISYCNFNWSTMAWDSLSITNGTSTLLTTSYTAQSAGRPAKAAGYYWTYGGDVIDVRDVRFPNSFSTSLATAPTAAGQTLSGPIATYIAASGGSVTVPSAVSEYRAAQASIPAVASQPYIAPWTTGGPYTGDSTTATLNGVTKTWLGGYYVTTPVASTYALVSTGAGQSLTYSVPAGGQLSYEYAF